MIDLHLHSNVSDGTYSPEEVIRRAQACGLTILGLADHDDASGVPAAVDAGRKLGATIVPAIELTARVDARRDDTVHILGYGIDPASEALGIVARKNRLAKRDQIIAMLDRLRALGIPIEDHEVGLDRQSDRYVGRNRIASALVVRGLAKNRLKAFQAYLSPGAKAYEAPPVVVAADVIAAIKAAGGVPVLAHPTAEDLERSLGKLCAAGIEGIEVFRPRAQGFLLDRIDRARERRGLLATGGSDWHGLYPEVPLGNWKVREEQVKPFLERIGVR